MLTVFLFGIILTSLNFPAGGEAFPISVVIMKPITYDPKVQAARNRAMTEFAGKIQAILAEKNSKDLLK